MIVPRPGRAPKQPPLSNRWRHERTKISIHYHWLVGLIDWLIRYHAGNWDLFVFTIWWDKIELSTRCYASRSAGFITMCNNKQLINVKEKLTVCPSGASRLHRGCFRAAHELQHCWPTFSVTTIATRCHPCHVSEPQSVWAHQQACTTEEAELVLESQQVARVVFTVENNQLLRPLEFAQGRLNDTQ